LRKKTLLSAVLAGLCAALMLACKETAVIHFFALVCAIFFYWVLKSKKSFVGFLPQKICLAALAVFVCVTILFFTWFGQNWHGLADLFRAIPNFAARAGGEGHEKPFWYYIKLLSNGWSGGIILGLAALGIFVINKGRRRGDESLIKTKSEASHVVSYELKNAAIFYILIYGLLIAVIYSAIPYKTPWLALNFFLPLAIFAGMAVEWIWFATKKISVCAAILVCLLALGFLIARDTRQWVFKFPADGKNPYAYAHTGEDLLRLPVRLEKLSRENKISDPRIAVVAADAWPLPWYLRKFSQAGFWQPGQETGAADFFITTTDVSGALAQRLKNFRPEYFGARPNVLLILWSPLPLENKP